jgi:hypothetical protein
METVTIEVTLAEEAMLERLRKSETWEAPWEPAVAVVRKIEDSGHATFVSDYEMWRDAIIEHGARMVELKSKAGKMREGVKKE